MSVRWVTLWVRPPLFEKMCVRSMGFILGASPLFENMCVRSLGYIVGASPPFENMCVGSLDYIVGPFPPLCFHSIGKTVTPRVCPFIGRPSSLDPFMLVVLIFYESLQPHKSGICATLCQMLHLSYIKSLACRDVVMS